MVKVERYGPGVVKAIVCRHCKSVLSYTEADESSFGGDPRKHYILCPVCDSAVEVTCNTRTIEDFVEESFIIDDPLIKTDPTYLAELNATCGKS